MSINLWPYLALSKILAKKKRHGFGNMFRHQMETFSILLEYGYEDHVLLKASLLHDLLEDGNRVGFADFNQIKSIDSDGEEVLDLVNELSIRVENGIEEPKPQFLERIMKSGSDKAKTLKLADRLSNINALPATFNYTFIERYIEETKLYIIPYSDQINIGISNELRESIRKLEAQEWPKML